MQVIEGLEYDKASRILDYDNRKGARKTGYNDKPIAINWPLEKANEEARRVCSKALRLAKGGFGGDMEYAKTVYDEYNEKGYINDLISDEHYRQIDLNKPEKKEPWEKDKSDIPIGFGDEEVTDNNFEKNADGTLSYKVRSMHFADPYGSECFNVVQLDMKVEVMLQCSSIGYEG